MLITIFRWFAIRRYVVKMLRLIEGNETIKSRYVGLSTTFLGVLYYYTIFDEPLTHQEATSMLDRNHDLMMKSLISVGVYGMYNLYLERLSETEYRVKIFPKVNVIKPWWLFIIDLLLTTAAGFLVYYIV